MTISLHRTVTIIVSSYAAMQLLFHFLNLPNTVLYVLPISLIPIFIAFKALSESDQHDYDQLSLLLLIFATLLSAVYFVSHPYPDVYDQLKFLFIFVFYFMGANINLYASIKTFRQAKFLLLGLPTILLGYYLFVLDGSSLYRGSVAFLANRNNFSGLVMTLFFALSVVSIQRHLMIILLPIVAIIGTLGGIVALLGGLFIAYFWRPKIFIMLGCALAGMLGLLLFLDIGLTHRLVNAYTLLSKMLASNLVDSLTAMSFADAFQVVGSDDTSVFFRLKQWFEIIVLMLNNTNYLVFGFGFSASETLTISGLLPHNDWLRVGFEAGLLGFLTFSTLVFVALRDVALYDKQSYVLALSLFVFMLTDNLIDNFLISFILFYFLGLTRQAARIIRSQSDQSIEPSSSTPIIS